MTTTLLTTVEVAERLGLSAAALAQAVRSGDLQAAAQTADDLLFSERAVAAYELTRAQFAAQAPVPAPEGSRAEWTSELGRLNGWLGELNASLVSVAPAPEAPAVESVGPQATPATITETAVVETAEGAQSAEAPTAAPVSAAAPAPAGVAPPPPAATTAPTPEPLPLDVHVKADLIPEPLGAPPGVASSIVPAAAAPFESPPPGPSRQVLLVLQPIERFRTLAEVAKALAQVPGLADARLEHVERGVASYRLTMADEPATGDDIATALRPLNLRLVLVEAAGT